MRTPRPRPGVGILIAVLATAAAALVRYIVEPILHDGTPFTIFLLAVVASGWLGGFWAGLTATLLGGLIGEFFFVSPVGQLSVITTERASRLLSYFLVGGSVSFVSELYHRSRRRLEATVAELRQSDALLRLAERTAGAGIWEVFDMTGGNARWSEKCHRLYGTDPAAYRPSLTANLVLIHPDDREAVRVAVRESIETRSEYSAEFRVQHQELGQRWIWEVGKAEYDGGGKPIRMAGIAVDSTARKAAEERVRESEAQFRAIADFAPAKLWITDAAGRCTYFSPKWYAFSGRTPEQDLGLGWSELLHPEDRPIVEETFAQASRDRVAFSLDVRFRRKDGVYRWSSDAGVPRFDEAGAFLGYVGVVIDVHERKCFEDDLRDADRRKDEFLATLAHELRNPLMPIRSGLHVMRLAERDSVTMAQARDMLDRQVAQMVRLIDDLLDVSRITSGKIELRKEWINLHDVVQSAVETTRPLIDSLGHELSVSLPAEPILLEADLTRHAQIFSNLLQNTAKYSERGGWISLTGRLGGDQAVVSVRDEGIGIPDELLPHVFDLFVQGDRSKERSQGGLGIGLTLVKRLVEMHGGTVIAHSDGAGHGSEFVVTIPTLKLPESDRRNGAPAERSRPAAAARLRVLVVDDNKDSVESLGMLLTFFGHEVAKAFEGADALRLAGTFRPEVMLLDLGMPGMSGYDVCREVRKAPWGADVFVIALTGWGQAEDRQRTREAGFDHHLVKPVEPAALAELLSSRPVRGETGRHPEEEPAPSPSPTPTRV